MEGFTVLNSVVEGAALALQPSLRPWEYSAALGMQRGERGFLAAEGTIAQVCYDNKALYLAFLCTDSKIVGAVQQPDGPVWMDDCVEVFIDPHAVGTQVFHIAITSRGTKFDEKFQEEVKLSHRTGLVRPTGRKWDCRMSFITGRSKDGWWVEMAIPFDSLDVKPPEPGAMWSWNLARWNCPPLSHGGIEFQEISTWSPAESSPGAPHSFGRLYFGQRPAAVVERLLPGISGEGINTAEVFLRELSGKGTRGRLILSTQTESGDLIETTSQLVALRPGGLEKFGLTYKIPPNLPRCYLAATLVSEGRERFIDSLDMPLLLQGQEVVLDVGYDSFIGGQRPIRALVRVNVGEVSVGAYGLRVELARKGKPSFSCAIERLESQRVEALIMNRDLEPGSYTLTVRLTKEGKVVAEAAKDIEILKSPFE
jgi:hypothetical protein